MVFDNSRFQGAVGNTLSTLKRLEQALKLDKASSGLEGISKAASQIDVADLASKVDNLASRFTGLKAIGTGALLAIGSAAVGAGQKLMSSMTSAITQGFGEYETKMGSIQTILANTSKFGTTLSDVSKSLGDLNTYADKTIYSFGDMTRNIGLFTNAGLKLEESTSMIKGFSNAAAASGTNAQGAAGAAYQLSQALSAGTIRLMDWRSLTNVGMGNDNMKKGLIDIATAMKTIDPKTKTQAMKDFNGSLEKGWLSADVMSKYLQIMAGDMDTAAMKALGLNDAQIKTFQEQQKTAEEAATKVRTLTQLTGTLMEALGSGWASTFEMLFGDFNEATELFTGMNEAIGGVLEASTKARNDMVKAWIDLGGRTAIIDGVRSGFESLSKIFSVIGDSFAKVFPVDGAKVLNDLSVGFRDLVKSLAPSEAQLKTFGNVLVGVFTAIKTVGGVAVGGITAVVRILAATFGVLAAIIETGFSKAADAVNSFMSGFGNFSIEGSFDGITNAIRSVVEMLDRAKDAILGWKNSTKSVEDSAKGFSILRMAGEGLRKGLDAIRAGLVDIGTFAANMRDAVGGAITFVTQKLGELFANVDISGIMGGIGKIKEGFAKALGSLDFTAISGIISSGALVLGLKYIRDLFQGFGELKGNISDILGIATSIKDAFGSLGGALDGAKTAFKADAVKSIATSLLILVAAMYVLSKIDGDNLGTAAAGMGVALATLASTLLMISKLPMNPVKILALGAALVVLSGAIMTLGLAVLIFGNMSWDQLVKGLTALAVTLGLLILSVAAFSLMSGNLIKVAISLQILSGALLMLTGVVAIFGAMPFGMLIQGGLALGILMAALVLFVTAMPEAQLMGTAAGMILMAVAIGGLVAAVAVLGAMPMDNLIQGLTSLAITMGLLVVAARLAQGSIGGAAAMVIMAVAINMLVGPLVALSLLPVEGIVQSLITIGVALGMLVAASMLMQGTLAGAAAMLIVAVSLGVLAGAILLLGAAGPAVVVTGLLTLAVAIGMFAGAAILLAPALPLMAGLAGVLMLFGAAVLLAGVGVIALAVGLGMLGAAAVVGGMGLMILAQAVIALAPHALTIAGMGLAFVALGAGLLAVGAGAMLAGAGFLILGVGLTMIAAAAIPGVIGLTAIVDAVGGMIMQAPGLGIMSAAFLALGVAMTAMGVGAALLAVGALAVTVGILALSAAAPLAEITIKNLGTAFEQASGSGAPAAFGAAIAVVLAAIAPLAPAMVASAAGVTVLTAVLLAVSSSGLVAAGALTALGAAASGSSAIMTGAMSAMSAATAAGVAVISSSLAMLGPAVGVSAAQVSAASVVMAAAFSMMGAQSAAAVISGSAQIIRALAPLPPAVVASAAAVTAASMLMVSAFRNMGVQASAAIMVAGVAIRAALSGIAASSGAAAVAVGTAIISGMVRGLANSGAVIAAARSVAMAALNAANGALGINSPSKEFEEIGEFANEGFARGLSGVTKAVNPVDQAFKDMEDRIAKALVSTAKRVADAQAAVDKYSANPKKYKKELDAARKELSEAKASEQMAKNASESLRSMWQNEGQELKKLRDEYDAVTEQVKDAEKAYEDAVRKRDDAANSYRDKYGKLSSMTGSDDEPMTYDKYIKNMQELNEKTLNYSELLESLRKKGLNNKLYAELLDSGLEALPFIEDLVLAGDNAILNMNKMADDLDSVSAEMGKRAGANLFQAGVDAAEGFLKGLQDEEGALEKAIEDLTSTIVNKIKSDLQIQSPSKVMAKLGKYTTEGLVKGLAIGVPAIKKTAAILTDQFQKELDRQFGSTTSPFEDILETDPVIKPVLDLSDVEAGAAAIQALIASGAVTPDISVNAANGVSRSVRAGKALEEALVGGGGDTYNYVQNNTSPKALNAGEIYRQTNNQISRIRKRL